MWHLIVILLIAVSSPAFAIDMNGYTAKYECRAGGTHCDVDVEALANQPCDQIIKTSTAPVGDWSAINWSNNVICIEAGDHTKRGTLKLGTSGTAAAYKVLRYFRTADVGDDPWNQSVSNRAIVAALDPADKDYWIIHRLSFTQKRTSPHINFIAGSASNNIIISRILGEGIGSSTGDESIIFIHSASDIWVQNSVVRNCQIVAGHSHRAINWAKVTRVRLVNNEVYNCAKGIASSFFADSADVVVENNDIYESPEVSTDCNGNFTPNGPCSISKQVFNLASGGTSQSGPVQVLHNRIWGGRPCDTKVSCSGGGGPGYAAGGGYDSGSAWSLYNGNIIFDSSGGINFLAGSPGTVSERHSVVGNIIWNIQQSPNKQPLAGIEFYAKDGLLRSNEVYLNTLVNIDGFASLSVPGTDSDIRCNVFISSMPPKAPSGSGTQMDYNVYYDTASNNEANKMVEAVSTRSNSTSYSVGDIVRTGPASACTTSSDRDCFLYMVTAAGVSAASEPSYCTTLGCTTLDGTMTVQAIRGPYTFYRKLRTVAGGEAMTIPYAMPDSSAPEVLACPSTTGSRSGIGVDDNAPF